MSQTLLNTAWADYTGTSNTSLEDIIERNMLKVALINPPQNTRYPQPPMGLALIAAVLEKEGYQVIVLDANALMIQPEEVAAFVTDANVVGLTAMTPTIGTAITTARHLKQANPDLTIILGGAHATLLPDETLANASEVDVLVRGEGENTIIELKSFSLQAFHPINLRATLDLLFHTFHVALEFHLFFLHLHLI